MSGKRLRWVAGLLVLVGGAGCCRMCDRWCGNNAPPPQCCSPCCTPCCPAPAPCGCAPPGSTNYSSPPPPSNWQRTPPANGSCPP
jgi:hypothetical protein